MDGNGTPSRSRPRPTPRQLAIACGAFVLGGILAIVVDRALQDSGPMRATGDRRRGARRHARGDARSRPSECSRSASGSRPASSRRASTADRRSPSSTSAGSRSTSTPEHHDYGPGAFFFVPDGQIYTLRVLDTAAAGDPCACSSRARRRRPRCAETALSYFGSVSGRIAILGAGKIGEALVAGLLSSGWQQPGDDRRHGRRRDRSGWKSCRRTLRRRDHRLERRRRSRAPRSWSSP